MYPQDTVHPKKDVSGVPILSSSKRDPEEAGDYPLPKPVEERREGPPSFPPSIGTLPFLPGS